MPRERNNGSPSIKAVILDYGRVLSRCPTAQDFGPMAEMFSVSPESFRRLWEASRGPYDRGDLTAEEYWLKLAADASTSLSQEQIWRLRKIEVEIWSQQNPAMLDWVSQLHAAGMRTALLSNMPFDLVTHVRNSCKWMDNFTFKTFSAEVGLIKPDPAIYEHTLRGLAVSASDTLFVDDHETNVRAARSLGIRAIQFQNVAQLRQELEALSFPTLPTNRESS